jgi:CRISPR-associated endonuclease/helicase Cas3
MKLELYDFQKETIEKIGDGKSILLRVPTGGGKTIGAIAPFVHMLENRKNFPKKLIYITPLRVLTNSLYLEISKLYPDFKVTIQTGEYSEDKLFEGDIIFTTIDQFLSSALAFPLSLSKSLANINAGAIFSSYLVFDEFHLLDENRSLKTAISLLEKIGDIVPFTIMSATFSTRFSKELAEKLNLEIVEISEKDSLKIPKARKTISTLETELSADEVLEKHKSRTIAICNTVSRAKALFREIVSKRPHQKTFLIHSQFFGSDRKEKEAELLKLFGKNSKAEDEILISTQVIEVGVDISCDVMHSEISPINSLLQRAGRLARYGGNGELYIYKAENFSIYSKELSEKTFEELSQVSDLGNYQKLVDSILTEKELEILKQKSNFHEIVESWRNNDKSQTRNLIRNINSVNVVLVDLEKEYKYLENLEAISIHPYSLKGVPAYFLKSENDIWGEEDFQKQKFEEISDGLEFYNFIALDSKKVGYSKEFGLDFEGNFGVLSKENLKSKLPEYAISKDTYSQHIEAMIRVYKREFSNLDYTIQRINHKFDFDEVVKYIIIMHDYGKLDREWQNWANRNYEKREILAHTDKAIGEKNRTPKSHAGVGGNASLELFATVKREYGENFNTLIATVITQHHSAQTEKSPKFFIEKENLKEISRLFKKYNLKEFGDVENYLYEDEILNLDTYLFNYKDTYLSILYFILIRTLRISDQKSFEEVKNVFCS